MALEEEPLENFEDHLDLGDSSALAHASPARAVLPPEPLNGTSPKWERVSPKPTPQKVTRRWTQLSKEVIGFSF